MSFVWVALIICGAALLGSLIGAGFAWFNYKAASRAREQTDEALDSIIEKVNWLKKEGLL